MQKQANAESGFMAAAIAFLWTSITISSSGDVPNAE